MSSSLKVKSLSLIALTSLASGCDYTSTTNARHLASWDYSDGSLGPKHWSEQFPTCGGVQQSPIDIPASNQFYNDVYGIIPPFGFAYDKFDGEVPEALEFENLGKTVEMVYTGHGLKLTDAEGLAYIVGRSDKLTGNEYTLEQFHFHWGTSDKTGSEHTFDGKHTPLEMHLVHYNSGVYESLSEAVASGNSDALLVVAFFFEISQTNGTAALDPLVEVLSGANFTAGTHVEVEGYAEKLAEMVENVNTQNFYLYNGGLTTPGCNEIVTWVLMKDRLPISLEQIDAFQFAETEIGETIAPNYRPSNPLYGRLIFDAELQKFAGGPKIVERDSASTIVMSMMSVFVAALALLAY